MRAPSYSGIRLPLALKMASKAPSFIREEGTARDLGPGLGLPRLWTYSPGSDIRLWGTAKLPDRDPLRSLLRSLAHSKEPFQISNQEAIGVKSRFPVVARVFTTTSTTRLLEHNGYTAGTAEHVGGFARWADAREPHSSDEQAGPLEQLERVAGRQGMAVLATS